MKRTKGNNEVDIDLDSSVEDEELDTSEMTTDEICRKFLPIIPKIQKKMKKITTANKTQNLEIEKLNEKVADLELENEMLYRKIHEKNLILKGLKEEDNETAEALKASVVKLIKEKLKNQPDITSLYRIGKREKQRPRQIKITFKDMESRDMVWMKKKELGQPHYVDEDLHRNARKKRGIMLKVGKEYKDKGQEVKYNFRQGTMSIDDKKYKMNGERLEVLRETKA